jgi:Na+/melibiose symporter-like transporter
MKSKSYTGIIYLAALLIAFLLLFSGCSATKYKVRRHNNRLIQEVQQHQNSLSAGQDWTRSYRNWDRRPKSKWPFKFLQ